MDTQKSFLPGLGITIFSIFLPSLVKDLHFSLQLCGLLIGCLLMARPLIPDKHNTPEDHDLPKDKKTEPQISNITGNRGIITQGQIGNNTIINPPAPRVPDGLYQGSLQVGKVQGPALSEDKSTIKFEVMSFNAYPNPNDPIEYQNYLLECDDVPKQKPNFFSGSFSYVIAGKQCKILRR